MRRVEVREKWGKLQINGEPHAAARLAALKGMELVANKLAVALTVGAFFGGLFVAASLGAGDPKTVRHYFPFALGGSMVVLDLAIRAYEWRKIVVRAAGATLLTREGPVPAPRRRFKEGLEALFSVEAGGQFFFVIPVWLVGMAVAVLAMFWRDRLFEAMGFSGGP